MLTIRSVIRIFSVGLMVLSVSMVFAQDPSTGSGQVFPSRPIRIVTSPPGGGSDFASRQIAQGLGESLGQPVIVENRNDISGAIVAKASPDGHTLLVDGIGFWIASLLQKTSYDLEKDFSPVTLITTSYYILVVHPSLPVKSVKELIAVAKAKPGTLNYGAGSGNAGGNTLATELFKSMTGVVITRVDYKGNGPMVTGLLGGEVQMAIASAASSTVHVKSGRLTALAVTSAQPTALAPGLPTIAASGVPGYEASAPTAVFAPAKTPATIVNRLSQEIARVVNRSDVKERFFNNGAETVGSTPAEFAARIKSDRAKWGKVIKDAGFRTE